MPVIYWRSIEQNPSTHFEGGNTDNPPQLTAYHFYGYSKQL
ncbi:hypothetical protein ACTTBA_11915 [Shewanella frigidimarina]|nr:hypothetical protein [Shewanella sp. SG44-2]